MRRWGPNTGLKLPTKVATRGMKPNLYFRICIGMTPRTWNSIMIIYWKKSSINKCWKNIKKWKKLHFESTLVILKTFLKPRPKMEIRKRNQGMPFRRRHSPLFSKVLKLNKTHVLPPLSSRFFDLLFLHITAKTSKNALFSKNRHLVAWLNFFNPFFTFFFTFRKNTFFELSWGDEVQMQEWNCQQKSQPGAWNQTYIFGHASEGPRGLETQLW